MDDLEEMERRVNEIAARLGMDSDELFCRIWFGDTESLRLIEAKAQAATFRMPPDGGKPPEA